MSVTAFRNASLALALSCSATLANLPAATLLAQDEPKKYDLKLDWKAVEGYKTEVSSEESMTMKISASVEGQVVNEEVTNEATNLMYTEVVVRVREDKRAESRLSFSKASHLREGREVPLGFQGKTVVVKVDAEGRHTFTYESGEAIAPEDMEVLSKLPDYKDEEPGEPSGEEIFAPKTPVAVGERWEPDIALMARSFGSNLAIDTSQSSATATLKSVTTRSGVDFGQVEVLIDLYIRQFGPLQLDKPVLMKMAVRLDDVCIDGKQPDGVMTMIMESEGESEASAPGAPPNLHISLDMNGRALVRMKTLM